MTDVLIVIDVILLLVCGGFCAYLTLLSILALVAGKELTLSTGARFAFVVPAHNEELGIGKTVKSLMDVDYPRDRFDVIVVADNCTDKTKLLAESEGAKVYERNDSSKRGKGYALRWVFDQLLSQSPAYDALVVIDADSTVTPNFLKVMNVYLRRGTSVIQSADLVAPQPGAWSSEVTRLGFILYNLVRPLGRKVLGFSPGLRGNGMCFSTAVLRRNPWQAYSLAEDLEYGLMLSIQGIRIQFAPEATVWATMPQEAKHARTQRARWEGGRFPVIARYAGKLAAAAIRQRSFIPVDALIDLVTPAFVNLLGFSVVMLLLNVAGFAFGIGEIKTFISWWTLVLWVGVVHAIVGLVAARGDWLLYRALLYVPRYAVWKLSTYTRMLFAGGTKDWIRTTREPR